MSLWKGNKKIKEIFSGNKLIDAVFKGNAQVYTRKYDKLISTASTGNLSLRRGSYYALVCGGGGAGGEDSTGWSSNPGGIGASSETKTYSFTLSSDSSVSYRVGDGGKIQSSGGIFNGGVGAGTDWGKAGNGGGGGYPSFIKVGSTYYISQGGGGGGGAGMAGRSRCRYGGQNAGGAGGGYYHMESNGTITNYAGKDSPVIEWDAKDGINGNTTLFPNITSGAGSAGAHKDRHGRGGNAAQGGGASGGGGGGAGNHDKDWFYSGSGGGGAGGSWNASGGGSSSQNGYNYHTDKLGVVNYLGQTVYSGNGVGGNVNTNGSAGYIYIHLYEKVYFTNDYGSITDTNITQTNDYGSITDTSITQHFNYGGI